MSLYRQAAGTRTSTLVVVGLVVLFAGAAAGFALGRGTAPEPTLSELADEVGEDIRPALSALELVTIEYPQAVREGQVVAETEYAAAKSQAGTAESVVASLAADLAALNPAQAKGATAAVERVTTLIEDRAQPQRVERAAQDAAAALEAMVPAA
jgi:hypothetical protein